MFMGMSVRGRMIVSRDAECCRMATGPSSLFCLSPLYTDAITLIVRYTMTTRPKARIHGFAADVSALSSQGDASVQKWLAADRSSFIQTGIDHSPRWLTNLNIWG